MLNFSQTPSMGIKNGFKYSAEYIFDRRVGVKWGGYTRAGYLLARAFFTSLSGKSEKSIEEYLIKPAFAHMLANLDALKAEIVGKSFKIVGEIGVKPKTHGNCRVLRDGKESITALFTVEGKEPDILLRVHIANDKIVAIEQGYAE